jgi:hypothetical protein
VRFDVQAPRILGLPFFSLEVFIFEPLAFWVAFFSLEIFIFEPLAFWGCLFFNQRSLFLSPLCFMVASFL